jgi:copper(I)-binding protein
MLKNLFFVTLLFASSLFASDIVITNAYVRAVPPNLSNSASFMKITNSSNKTISLLSVNSNIAENIELHEHVMSNGMMKMQQIPSIKVPANSTIELKPGGLHVMLIGLNKKLKMGEKVDSFTFNFSDKTSMTIKDIPVKSVMMGMKHK